MILGGLYLPLSNSRVIIYFVVVIYNGYRLSMSIPLFMNKNGGIHQTLRESWNMTKGNVLSIFLAYLVFGVVAGIVSFIIGCQRQYTHFSHPLIGPTAQLALSSMDFTIFLLLPTFIVSGYVLVGLAFLWLRFIHAFVIPPCHSLLAPFFARQLVLHEKENLL